MKKKIPGVFFMFTAMMILSFSVSACKGKTAGGLKEIRIGFPTSGGDWPAGVYGVAITNGYLDTYLEPLGYKVSPKGFVGAAPAIHEALVAKELDYVVYAGMAADLSRANGIEHTLISTTSWGALWKILVHTDSGIDTLADLRGKKVAYTRGASPHMYLIRVLTEAGLTFNDIKPINATLPESLAALTTGTIDATVVSAGYEKQLVDTGTAKVIHNQFTADKNVYYEPMVFIARTDFHKAHPEVALAIQKAFLRGRDWIREDPDRYYRLVSERSGNPLDVVLETADYDIDGAIPLNLDNKYIDALKDILIFLKSNELTGGNIDFTTWQDKTVAEKAWKEYADGN